MDQASKKEECGIRKMGRKLTSRDKKMPKTQNMDKMSGASSDNFVLFHHSCGGRGDHDTETLQFGTG